MTYSQNWLNLPRDDHHFGYKQKFLQKNTDLRGNAKRERPYTESKQRKRFSKLDGYAKVNRSKEKTMGEESRH